MITDHQKQRARSAERRVAMAFLATPRGKCDVGQPTMFGSRAPGGHEPDNDLDLAIILNGQRSDFMDIKLDMAGIAFNVMMETGILEPAFPMWDDGLAHLERFTNPTLIQNIVADGIRLE